MSMGSRVSTQRPPTSYWGLEGTSATQLWAIEIEKRRENALLRELLGTGPLESLGASLRFQ